MSTDGDTGSKLRLTGEGGKYLSNRVRPDSLYAKYEPIRSMKSRTERKLGGSPDSPQGGKGIESRRVSSQLTQLEEFSGATWRSKQ